MSSIAGSGCEVIIPKTDKKPVNEIERSIITTYKKDIWRKFNRAINEYELVQDGDKIAVGISGGKDSLLMAKMFQELQKHGRRKFELEFISMDPGFHESNKNLLISNCEYLNIPVKLFESGIFKVVDEIAKEYPCYMCARMRRGFLYSKAQELGCNKLALAHHFNDVIETTMLNLLYAGCFKTMLPKLKSTNFSNMELIRPLYHIEEHDIKRYTENSGILCMNCGCVVAAQKTSSKRREMKDLIKDLKKVSFDIDKNIFQAANNANLGSLLGWEINGVKHSFLEDYDQE